MTKYLSFLVLFASACSSVKKNEKTFNAHAESFNILFLQIPGGNTQDRAMALVPEGAEVETIISVDSDTNSLMGVLNRILGIDYTQINGMLEDDYRCTSLI
jgi:hypothetical protein